MRKRSVGGRERERESPRDIYSAVALSSTHVVSTQFAMKYRGDHRHARTIITGCPHLAGCCTQLPLSWFFISIFLSPSPRRHSSRLFSPLIPSLSLLLATFVFFLYSLKAIVGKKNVASKEIKFIRDISSARIVLIRFDLKWPEIRSLNFPQIYISPNYDIIGTVVIRLNILIGKDIFTDWSRQNFHFICILVYQIRYTIFNF